LDKALDTISLDLTREAPMQIEAIIDVSGPSETMSPVLFSFSFRNADGLLLDGPHDGLLMSTLYGPYIYTGSHSEQGAMVVRAVFTPPPTAASAVIELHRWRAAQVRLIEKIQLVSGADGPATPDYPTIAGFPILDELAQEVTEHETYDIDAVVSSTSQPGERSVLAAVAFEDAQGRPVDALPSVPVSGQVGPYRYMSVYNRETPLPEGQSAMSASFTAPAGATRMTVSFIQWDKSKPYRISDIQVDWLTRTKRIVAEGEARLRVSSWFVLKGRVRAEGGSGNEVALVAFTFLDDEGRHLQETAGNLAASARFRNYAYVKYHNAGDLVETDLHIALAPPKGARSVRWRVLGWNDYSLTVLQPLNLRGLRMEASSLLSYIPDEAKVVPDFDSDQLDELHDALPDDPIWPQVAQNKLGLLAEAVAETTEGRWLELDGVIDWGEADVERHRPILCPVYLDQNGVPLKLKTLIGCAKSDQVGLYRYPVLLKDAAHPDQLRFREAFLAPPGAAIAVIFLLTLKGLPEGVGIQSFQCFEISVNDVFRGLDTSVMNQAQLQQAVELAETTWDLHARRDIYAALALLDPLDKKSAGKARALTDQLAELSTEWRPRLPAGEPYTPDPDSVMHLFKVLYPDENSGGAVRSTSIAEAQAVRGLKPVACLPLSAPRAEDVSDSDGIVEVVRNGVAANYLVFPQFSGRGIAPADTLQFETSMHNRVLRKHRCSLIHAASGFRGYENALKGIALAEANDLPFVYEVRSFHEHTWRPITAVQMGDSITMLREAQENRCMAAADTVATISRAMVDNLKSRGVPEEKLFFVPNSISEEFHEQIGLGPVARLRDQHGISGKITLGYISNFSLREGHILLLDAFTRLIAEGHDLYLVMVGDGPEWKKIKAEVDKRKLARRVIMPGNVDHTEIRAWYRVINLFVVPRIEDFASDYVTPLKPFEAMSQGVPVIMSERPVTAEIAGNSGEWAATFPAGDVPALMQMIKDQLADPEALRARTERARAWVLQERVWTRTVERYDEIYAVARERHAQNRRAR